MPLICMCCYSDGGLLIMGKAAQEKVRFRWYDMTRYEVSNKVGLCCNMETPCLCMHCQQELVSQNRYGFHDVPGACWFANSTH